MVEQLTLNQLVEGSSPSRSTIIYWARIGIFPFLEKGAHWTSVLVHFLIRGAFVDWAMTHWLS